MTKQKILASLIHLFGKQYVAVDGNKITVGVEDADRANRTKIAKLLAKKFKGKESERVVKIGEIRILVKPRSSVTTKEKSSLKFHYAYLKNFLKTHETASFSKICDPVAQRKLPNQIKEGSDIYLVSKLNDLIKKKIDSENKEETGTTIVLAGEKYTNVLCCVPIIRGDEPKADFCLVCVKGKAIVPRGFFSYKMGTKPSEFGGYSGISEKAGKSIHNHPEVKKFIQALHESVQVGKVWTNKSKTTLKIEPYRVIQDSDLKKLAVFGPDAKSTTRGPNNCDAILQGTPSISGNTVSFDHEHNRKSRTFEEGYTPVLGARKDSKRNLHYGDIVIEKMRVGIFHDGYRRPWKERDKTSKI